MTHTRSFTVCISLTAAISLLAGCTATSPESESMSMQSSPTLPTTDTSQSLPASDAQSLPNSQSSAAPPRPIDGDNWVTSIPEKMPTLEGQAVLHDIQATEHEDFYRVVVEFAGESDQETTGELGWFIGWTESLASQGKGDPIALDKKTVLELNIEGTTAPVTPELETLYYSGPQEFSVGEITVVDDGTFESLTHIGIGMDAERPFQVRQLGNPLRLIVDIQK